MKRSSSSAELSELEGAALAAVKTLAPCTPYRVREVFLNSPADVWSGSAGAIYPLLRRLETAKLVRAREQAVGRKTRKLYRLTAKGERALTRWMFDPARGAGMGFDPLRTRLANYRLSDTDALCAYAEACLATMRAQTPSPEPEDPVISAMHEIWLTARERAVGDIVKLLRKKD